MDSFIISVKVVDKENEYQLLNPSIADFLLNYLRENSDERNRILHSIIYIDQLTGYFDPSNKNKIILNNNFLESYYPILIELANKFENRHYPFEILNILCCIDLFFQNNILNNETDFHNYLLKLVKSDIDEYVTSSKLIKLIENIQENYSSIIKNIVISNWSILISLIINNAHDRDDLAELENLHSLYSIDLSKTINNENIKSLLIDKVSELFENYASDIGYIANEGTIIENYHERGQDNTLKYIEDKLWDSYSGFFVDCGLSDYFDSFDHEYNIDTANLLNEIIQNNNHIEEVYSLDAFIDQSPFNNVENKLIEELFER